MVEEETGPGLDHPSRNNCLSPWRPRSRQRRPRRRPRLKKSGRLSRSESFVKIQSASFDATFAIAESLPIYNATVSAFDRCGGPYRHRVIWSFFLLLIVVSFLLLCLAFSPSHFSHACSPDGYPNHQDFWRALPLSCTVPMLFVMDSTSVRSS